MSGNAVTFTVHSVSDYDEEEKESFHASLFEEEWKKRTSVLFDIEDDDPEVVSCLFTDINIMLLNS